VEENTICGTVGEGRRGPGKKGKKCGDGRKSGKKERVTDREVCRPGCGGEGIDRMFMPGGDRKN